MAVVIVSASRLSEYLFYSQSLLGRTLATTFRGVSVSRRIYFENARPLADCYNDAIDKAGDDDILVFVHDDVLFADFFWFEHVGLGLSKFDVVGVAGNRRRVPNQPSWLFVDRQLTRDHPSNLSGSVGHGDGLPCDLSIYGPPLEQCKLLDGVFLATRRRTLMQAAVRFDPAFKFHFYDMDLCRQCEASNLTMGTIPMSLVHKSTGAFGTLAWTAACADYLKKWGG